MEISITLIIIIATCIISISAFSNEKIIGQLIFYPPAVNRGQWYRLFSCGLIHADIGHLMFNMYALYIFGVGTGNSGVEYSFIEIFGENGKWIYLLMYVLALIVSLLPTYFKNVDNHYYRSLGASGAVSAVIFAGILLDPANKIYLMFIPVGIPGFVFGPVYLLISAWLDRKGSDNINHSAHIWGALFGVAFMIIAGYASNEYNAVEEFVNKIRHYFNT